MTVRKRGNKWYFDFDNHRHRGVIPLARTKAEAEQAEVIIKRQVFEGTFGLAQMGQQLFTEFVKDIYLPWAKTNKRTWHKEAHHVARLREAFAGKRLMDISSLQVEKLKREELNQPTIHNKQRSAASVNSLLNVLSSMFTLAVDVDAARINPCRKVKLLALDNLQTRYLLWDEEPALMTVLECPAVKPGNGRTPASTLMLMQAARRRLRDAVVIAIGLGPRRSEQLRMQVQHCDFNRKEVFIPGANDGQTSARGSKPQKGRWVPMNDDVLLVLRKLCQGKRREQYLFENKTTSRPYQDFSNGFQLACADAGIENLTWRNLRDTFGTRLGEAGHNAYDIADLMGHTNISTTRRYVRTEPRKRAAVQATMLSNRKAAVA